MFLNLSEMKCFIQECWVVNWTPQNVSKNDFTGQDMLRMYNIDAKLVLLVLHGKPSTSFQATVDASWLRVG